MGRRRVLSAVSVAGLAVVLTGCMKFDVDLTINENDTVDGEMVIGLDRGLAEMSGDPDAMIEDMLAETDVPEGASAEGYEDDDYLGTRYLFDGQPLDTFDGDGTDESLSIVRDGDEFVVSGSMDMSAVNAENMGELGGLSEGMLDSLDIRIAFTFPGEIIETTGEVDGNTVVWEPTAGEVADISARASATPSGIGGLPIWAWVLIGVVVVAALVGLFFMIRRSNKAVNEPAPAGAYGQTPPAPSQPGQEQQQSGPPAAGVGTPVEAPPAPPAPGPPTPEPPTPADPDAGPHDADSDQSPEPPRPRDV